MVKHGEQQPQAQITPLIGEFRTHLVAGNRAVVPSFFRQTLGERDLVITKGYEQSLILMNQPMWGNLLHDIQDQSYFRRSLRETTRFLVGSAVQVNPDQQGRIVLSESHMDHLHIRAYTPRKEQKLVFVGLINWVEIWNLDLWMAHHEYLAQHGEELAEELNTLSVNKSTN